MPMLMNHEATKNEQSMNNVKFGQHEGLTGNQLGNEHILMQELGCELTIEEIKIMRVNLSMKNTNSNQLIINICMALQSKIRYLTSCINIHIFSMFLNFFSPWR